MSKLLFEHTECSRCGGTGEHSYCYEHGTRCFKCSGSGWELTKRGQAAQNYFNELITKPVSEIKPGDKFMTVVGNGAIIKNIWATAVDVRRDDERNQTFISFTYGNSGKDGCTFYGDADTQVKSNDYQELKHQALEYQKTLNLSGTICKRGTPAPIMSPEELREKREATRIKREKKQQEKEEFRRLEHEAKQLTFMEENREFMDILFKAAERDNFCESIKNTIMRTLKFSEKQRAAVYRAIERINARKATKKVEESSEYIGEISQRIEALLTEVNTMSFNGYYGTFYIQKMHDEDGNVIVYKGSTPPLSEKETAKCKFTVKAHDEYKGIKQTVGQRFKI